MKKLLILLVLLCSCTPQKESVYLVKTYSGFTGYKDYVLKSYKIMYGELTGYELDGTYIRINSTIYEIDELSPEEVPTEKKDRYE